VYFAVIEKKVRLAAMNPPEGRLQTDPCAKKL